MSADSERRPSDPQNLDTNPMAQRFIDGVDLTDQGAIRAKITELTGRMETIGLEEYRAHQEGRPAYPIQNLGPSPVDREPRITSVQDVAHDHRQSENERAALESAIGSLRSRLVS